MKFGKVKIGFRPTIIVLAGVVGIFLFAMHQAGAEVSSEILSIYVTGTLAFGTRILKNESPDGGDEE